MAAYVPVEPGDPNHPALNALAARIKKYVVTWQYVASTARVIYGVYHTQKQAFRGCQEALKRIAGSAPLCFLISGAAYFKVVAENQFTH